ncbi:hypothetical protein WKI65_42950 [Streptomyces sp. MS1.AVA.3]
MSCNRDNVTWQAPDGTWSIGFWRFAGGGAPPPPVALHPGPPC